MKEPIYVKSRKEGRGVGCKDAQKLMEIRRLAEEYICIDGGHHKQYALVRIAKIAGSVERFVDEGIPD